VTHISKRTPKKQVVKELSEQFLTFIMEANTARQAHSLVMELMTNSERIMLAKRLAIVVMLEYGYTFEQIERTLKVSSSTVTLIWRKKRARTFPSIETYCRRHKALDADAVIGFIEKLLQAGLPPRGRGRWKHVLKS